MTTVALLSGWTLAAVMCWRWSTETEKRHTAESLNRSLLAANAEKNEVIESLLRERVAKLNDRVFALLPADDQADRWSRYEVQ